MKTDSTNSELRGGGEWPVLARLPDVSDQLTGNTERARRAAAAGFVNYRFDPPQSAERVASGSAAAPMRSAATAEPAGPAAPHIFSHAPQRSPHRASSVLPRSDLFGSADSPAERFGPVIRFLCMFAVFTAAGTWILTTQRRLETPVQPAQPPTTTASQPSLELEPFPERKHEVERPAAAPTARGPLGSTAPRLGERPTVRGPVAVASPQVNRRPASASPRNADAAMPRVQLSERSSKDELANPVVRSDNGPSDADARGPGRQPALARLPGYVLPTATHQAQHDDQSSLH